jgi:hypothetical protein
LVRRSVWVVDELLEKGKKERQTQKRYTVFHQFMEEPPVSRSLPIFVLGGSLGQHNQLSKVSF